jgi:hypothetical protein
MYIKKSLVWLFAFVFCVSFGSSALGNVDVYNSTSLYSTNSSSIAIPGFLDSLTRSIFNLESNFVLNTQSIVILYCLLIIVILFFNSLIKLAVPSDKKFLSWVFAVLVAGLLSASAGLKSSYLLLIGFLGVGTGANTIYYASKVIGILLIFLIVYIGLYYIAKRVKLKMNRSTDESQDDSITEGMVAAEMFAQAKKKLAKK